MYYINNKKKGGKIIIMISIEAEIAFNKFNTHL